MNDQEFLAARFEDSRAHLQAVAFRMLGSRSEADDAVQEAWLRLSRADTSQVENLTGWLTTVTARVCLDMLRCRTSRREDELADDATAGVGLSADPEAEAVLADSVGLAMLVVLDALTPAERVAFVLHDIFTLTFEDIAPIVGRSADATRQLASRARRRVKGGQPADESDFARRRALVDAFRAASRNGNLAALIGVLDPNVVLRSDPGAKFPDGESEVVGAEPVAKFFLGRARGAQPAVIDGSPGLVWAPGGKVRVVFRFTLDGDAISAIELLSEKEVLGAMDLTILDG
jgi:RNA polymerase sigma-70 factor (ECF subfamily)